MKKLQLTSSPTGALRTWHNGRYVLIGAALLLILAILVRQQLNWLNQASESQLASGQRELSLALANGVDDARNDLWRLYNDVIAGKDSHLVQQQLQMSVGQTWPNYSEDDVRYRWLRIFQQAIGNTPNPFEIQRIFERRRAINEFLIVNVSYPQVNQALLDIRILELDLINLTETIIQPALTNALADYFFILTINQKTIIANGEPRTNQSPDVIIPLSRLLQLPLEDRRQDARTTGTESIFNRDFSRLYELILSSSQQDESVFSDQDLNLAVFSPDGALEQNVAKQKWRNGFFSIMVLGLLSITVIVLLGMTRRIKAQQQRERDFISSISHELRTPLTVIRSAADNLKDGVVSSPDSIARYGLEISKQSKRLARMVDTTLTYSGLPGRESQQLETVPAQEFFNDLFNPLIELAAEQNVTCLLTVNKLDDKITVDADALRTISQNLVMNAVIHATPDSDPAYIWLTVSQTENELKLSVADNGPGIPKKEQKRVFSPFIRGTRSEQNQQPGTGLGLSLVKRTVAILQGEIALHSPYQSDLGQTEKGCLFIVTLPIRASHDT